MATPMLAPQKAVPVSSSKAADMRLSTSAASTLAAVLSKTPRAMIANSSPPSRATVQ